MFFALIHKLTTRRDYMRTLPNTENRLFRALCRLTAASFFIFCYSPLIAQTVSASSHTAKATASVIVPPSLSVEDTSFGLADGLVRELRNGGYTLYLRHGALLPTPVDKVGAGEWWKDCQNTRRIGPEVQAQMRAIAEAFSRQKIAVYEVLTSEFCRAYDTAILLGLTAPQRNAALNEAGSPGNPPQSATTLSAYAAGIQQLLARPLPPKTNRVLVGHVLPPTIIHASLSTLPEGHTAIFKIEPGNRFHYITTLSPGQWQWIGKQAIVDFVPVVAAQAPQVTASPTPTPNIALIDPAKEMKGAVLLQALRRGGFNLYMRHAISNIGQDGNLNQTPFWWDNCTIQRNIADSGREQAGKVGAAIRNLNIPVSQVLTAQFCRTRDTGHAMGLGPIEITEDLNHQIGQRTGFDVNVARFRQLTEQPLKGTNRVLVSHTHGSPKTEERIMGSMQESEIVVYQPDGKGNTEPVARIPVVEWENLLKIATAPKP